MLIIKKIITFVISFVRRVFTVFFFLFPVKNNKILFINFLGKGFGCNPKYIALELLSRDKDYDIVWLVNDKTSQFPDGIRKVIYRSIGALYEVATAKVIITNVKNDLRLIKKKEQFIIQTWHGSYSAKLLEKDASDKLNKDYLKESQKNSKQTDLFLSNSRVLSNCYREAFWCECEIMECGFPRNDILFAESESINYDVRQKLSLRMDSKLLLYAPTFRDDGSTEGYNIDCDMLKSVLSNMGKDWKILIRMHPNVNSDDYTFAFNDDIIDVSKYPDMQELLIASDILVTDYSSSVFEFAVMGKPVFIFASDIEHYQRVRGLKDDFFDTPYPICRTNQELKTSIESFNFDRCGEISNKFMKVFGGVDDGKASKRVVDRIIKVMQ